MMAFVFFVFFTIHALGECAVCNDSCQEERRDRERQSRQGKYTL